MKRVIYAIALMLVVFSTVTACNAAQEQKAPQVDTLLTQPTDSASVDTLTVVDTAK